MSTSTVTFDPKELEAKVQVMYQDVAENPHGEFHFEMGRAMAERLGYAPADLDRVPAEAIESFAGVGYYFHLANLKEGETVVDLGSGLRDGYFCGFPESWPARSRHRHRYDGRAAHQSRTAARSRRISQRDLEPIINLREWQQRLPRRALPRSLAPIHVDKELALAANVLRRAPTAGRDEPRLRPVGLRVEFGEMPQFAHNPHATRLADCPLGRQFPPLGRNLCELGRSVRVFSCR
jgi:hypothetical protein